MWAILADPNPVDMREIFATVGPASKPDLVSALMDELDRGLGYVAFYRGQPVMLAGLTPEPHAPHRWQAFGFGTRSYWRGAPVLVKLAKSILLPFAWDSGAHRIEAKSLVDHTNAHSWIVKTGGQKEALIRAYGFSGEDFFQFSWLKDGVRTCASTPSRQSTEA